MKTYCKTRTAGERAQSSLNILFLLLFLQHPFSFVKPLAETCWSTRRWNYICFVKVSEQRGKMDSNTFAISVSLERTTKKRVVEVLDVFPDVEFVPTGTNDEINSIHRLSLMQGNPSWPAVTNGFGMSRFDV
jgi:hypothetical protein